MPPLPERIVVGGSRLALFQPQIARQLTPLPSGTTIIHGGAEGVDLIAEAIALECGLLTQAYPVSSADWKKYGKRAGPRRNRIMLRESCPDRVLAFWDGLSPGTENLIQEAQKLRLRLEIISLECAGLPELTVQLEQASFRFRVWQGRIVGGDPYGLAILRQHRKKLCERGAFAARTVWQFFRDQGAVLARVNHHGGLHAH